ncbi:hypothetical protein R6138_04353 [Ralstonia thomasii]|uniref:hypothetical protein n=1 Tax=Ralstonia thomasii TaxID=3058596 RepID=UPI0028F66D68|nr:hypothetical protein [Ralstonia sp. LMG 18095]CAJ0899611.1 hypothetical protein R6138_04353 [Ralstonia sp. LMG 18095]
MTTKNPKQELTPWFPAIDIPPIYEGRYLYKYDGTTEKTQFFVVFNGLDFIIDDNSNYSGEEIIVRPGDEWRGLANKP